MFAKLLPLLLGATLAAQTYTLTPFGTSCGADLQGQVVQGPQGAGLRVGVTNAPPGAVAVLVLGGLAAVPQPLPGSTCTLLVNPRVTNLSTTNRNGNAAFFLRLPPVLPITIHMQAVTIDATRAGRSFEATGGLRLDGV